MRPSTSLFAILFVPIAAVAVTSCGDRTATGSATGAAVTEAVTVPRTTIPDRASPPETPQEPMVPTSETGPDNLPTPPMALAVQDNGCAVSEPAVKDEGYTVHTVVPRTEPVTVKIYAPGVRVCPGASMQVGMVLENDGVDPVVLANADLQLAKIFSEWHLASLTDVALAAGETRSVVVDVHVPAVNPGTYYLDLYGYQDEGKVFLDRPDGT